MSALWARRRQDIAAAGYPVPAIRSIWTMEVGWRVAASEVCLARIEPFLLSGVRVVSSPLMPKPAYFAHASLTLSRCLVNGSNENVSLIVDRQH